MNKKSIQKMTEVLKPFISENKQQKIEEVLNDRTNHICIVLEDIFQPHNASATIRTCDCLGIQNIHLIENRNAFSPSRNVMQGAGKWINLHRYNENLQQGLSVKDPSKFPTHNTQKALKSLKKQGYQLIATTPDAPPGKPNPKTLKELDLSKPTAFLFGTEALGLSPKALDMADEFLRLPMVGFTQSFNISVTVAITLARSMQRLWDSDIDWQLSPTEKCQLTFEWYQRILGKVRSEKILNREIGRHDAHVLDSLVE